VSELNDLRNENVRLIARISELEKALAFKKAQVDALHRDGATLEAIAKAARRVVDAALDYEAVSGARVLDPGRYRLELRHLLDATGQAPRRERTSWAARGEFGPEP
jgi:hypothetical protein